MRNERDMIRALLDGKAWKEGLTFSDEELRQIDHPLLMVYGDQDATGTVQTWQRFVALMPNAEIEVLEEAGHVPWLDNPDSVSAAIKGFLSRR